MYLNHRSSLWGPPHSTGLWCLNWPGVTAVGNSGTGKNYIALGHGIAACQRGLSVGFIIVAALVQALIEARDVQRLLNV